MSKSLGNGIDPMDVIEEYGADSLRYFLATNSAPGQDLRYDAEKVKSTWNFINKLWNASRYVLMNLEDFKEQDYQLQDLSLVDKWIITKNNETIKEVTKNMDCYEFNNAGSKLYAHIWEDFCDNYIELTKGNMNNTTKSVLIKVLSNILKMLHPFMPYVTEEIYKMLPIKDQDSIMISTYPAYNLNEDFKDSLKVDKIITDIKEIRNLKKDNNITKDAYVKITTVDDSLEVAKIYKSALKINDDKVVLDPVKDLEEYHYQSPYIDITYFEKGEEIDKDKILEKINSLEASIAKRQKLLSNQNYLNKAPKHIVELDQVKLKEELASLENLKQLL